MAAIDRVLIKLKILHKLILFLFLMDSCLKFITLFGVDSFGVIRKRPKVLFCGGGLV